MAGSRIAAQRVCICRSCAPASGWRATRTRCNRAREARRRTPSQLARAGSKEARNPQGSGPFPWGRPTVDTLIKNLQPRPALAGELLHVQAEPACDRIPAALAAGALFNKLPRNDAGTGRPSFSHSCGCSSVGRARPCHGRGHEFETRHPLHVGCVRAKARVRRRACAWPRSGQRAADHLVHRVVRAWAQPTWIMCLVRLTARTPGFHLGNTGSIPVRDTTTTKTTRSPRRSRASRAEIGRNDRAAPEPVTGKTMLR